MNNYILPIKSGSQIGLFGGSFNPAHEWHFQVSKNALGELNLNQVIWLVSMSNPLKEDEDIMDFHDRFMSARDIAKKNISFLLNIIDAIKCFQFRIIQTNFNKVWF